MDDFVSYNELVEQGITPRFELSISNNPVKRPLARNIGRALLPKRFENWFLGNQEDEDLLNKYSDNDLPTYDEINENYKSGLYNKDDLINYSNLRNQYEQARANRDFTDVRNANIGQGIVDVGSAAIGGGGATATKVGTRLLRPLLGKKIALQTTQGLLGGGLGGAAHGFGTGLVQEDVNPLTQGLIEGGIGLGIGGAIGLGLGQIGKRLAYNNLFKNDGIGLGKILNGDETKFTNYFDDYVSGLKGDPEFITDFSQLPAIGERTLFDNANANLRLARQGLRPRATTAEGAFDILVDESGNPTSFYHSTPNAGFTEFDPGSFFTKNLEYSKGYKHPSASAKGVKKTANNPGTYEVNLDLNNPFDTRNPVARDIFNKEYQAYYSPELTERGLVDWMEAEDLSDWLKANHPEYDSLIVDEGGAGGGAFGGQPVVLHGESYIPFDSDQVLIKNLESEKPVDLFNEIIKENNWKKKQSNLIKKHNPMLDDYHTGIRSSKDVKTPDEVFNIENFTGTPDFKYNDAVKARRDGFIKIYSSKPIEEGGFITPSKMQAKDYAGENGEIHEAIVPLKDIAWIDSTEGQYAPLTHKEYGLSNEPLQFTGKSVKMEGETYRQLKVGEAEYRRLMKEFNQSLSPKEKASKYFAKPIGESNYYVINNGFNEPMLTWKELLK